MVIAGLVRTGDCWQEHSGNVVSFVEGFGSGGCRSVWLRTEPIILVLG